MLNNQSVTDALDREETTSISCFNFSTLCTNINHDKSLKTFNTLIDFCFKGGDREFISGNGQMGLNRQKIEGQICSLCQK